jgi:enterobacterial common antigen flippase
MNKDIQDKSPNSDEPVTLPSSALQEGHKTVETVKPEKHTYGQILKSTAIIGGSSVINIVIRMFRTKIMALLLGPSGIGLMGLYETIIDLTQKIVGMGINSSGVRQIAEAVGSDDEERISRTAQVLRRTSIFLGLLGAVFMFGFSTQLAEFTFGNDQHATGVAFLSLAVFCNLLADGQGALIQGMRRISDLAKIAILGTLLGTITSIICVYFLHEDGVVLSLVLISGMGLITSWWYKRKIVIPSYPLISSQVGHEQAALLKLGFAFMSSGLMVSGSAYLVRIFIVRNVSFDAAGLYQSAWTLGGLYIGFILQAMGADFYPRLTAIVNNHSECNRVVNEQAHVSLLLAGPGVIATLTFAPLAIVIFYTSKFDGAIELLRWLCLGMTLRVISWPMGFIIVAKNVQKLFFFAELAWTTVYLALAWICVRTFGLNGAGIAFFGSYVFHVAMIYCIVRKLTDFRWTAANVKTSFFFLTLIAIVFASFYIFPSWLTIVIGSLATALSAVYSIRVLVNFISPDRIPRSIMRLLVKFRLTSPDATQRQAATSGAKPRLLNIKWLTLVLVILGVAYLAVLWHQDPQSLLRALDNFKAEFKSVLASVDKFGFGSF